MIDGVTHIQESYVNTSDSYSLGDDTYSIKGTVLENCETVREAFDSFQKEYGRCVSKVYVDTADGTKQIGWCFESRQKYEDSDETYLREVWVTLLSKYDPSPTIEYAEIVSTT